ncbi:UNVERIFIED_CONTAM: secY [Trichonephila clavipes]
MANTRNAQQGREMLQAPGMQKGMSELWRRIGFLLFALLVFRLGAHIPVPGINPQRLAELFDQNKDTILSLFNMFSGGALERMSILALGIMPYISASIIMQLAATVIPSLEALKKEGEAGRRQINQYTRYGTVLLALIQALGMSAGLISQGITLSDGLTFYIPAVASLVAGAVFLMWLGEQITERGVGRDRRDCAVRDRCPGHGRGRRGGVHGAWPASHHGAVRSAPAGSARVRRAAEPSAAEAQHGGCHSGHLRELAAAVPGQPRAVVRPGAEPECVPADPAGGLPPAGTGTAALPAAVRAADHLLLLLLHRAGVQPARCSRQPEEVRRLHSRHPPGRADQPLHRWRAEPPDPGRFPVHHGGLSAADDPAGVVQRPVLPWRHVVADRGGGGHGLHVPGPVPPDVEPVRVADEEGQSARLRPGGPDSLSPVRLQLSTERIPCWSVNHESSSLCEKDLRQLQDRPPQRKPACHLQRGTAPQAASGLISGSGCIQLAESIDSCAFRAQSE